MPNIIPFIRKSFKFDFKAVKQNRELSKDRDFFKPIGIQVFWGPEGSGKSIVMADFFHRIKSRYPKALILSNMILNNYNRLDFDTAEELKQHVETMDVATDYIFYQSKEQYALINMHVRNGSLGVIVLTDEYQNYFSNQDSRNVPDWVIQQNAQNRKQRRIVLATSQDYDQLVKATRRRADVAFRCRTFGLPLTFGPILSVYWGFNAKSIKFDGDGVMAPLRRLGIGWFFHTQELRDSYDTYQVVFTGDKAHDVYQPSSDTSVPKKRKVVRKSKIFIR